MKICVLGSNSFCGSSYVDQSLRLGHEVLAVSRRPELGPEFLQYASNLSVGSQLQFLEYDLNTGTSGQLAVELEKFKPSIVLNFAPAQRTAFFSFSEMAPFSHFSKHRR